jgi:DNA-binding NarL/FixJ family response regulator
VTIPTNLAIRVGEIGRRLASRDASLNDAAEAILEVVAADRVSLAAIDDAAGAFEIVTARGEALLEPGVTCPLELSTHHLCAAEGRTFVRRDLDSRRGFSRPVDQIVRAHGFRAGASLPLRHANGVAGALNLHFNEPGDGAQIASELLEPILGTLSVALAEAKRRLPRVLICHEDGLIRRGMARLLEESGMEEVGLACSRAEALASMQLHPADVIVLDERIDGRQGDGLVPALRASGIDTPAVIVAACDARDGVPAAVRAGAAGYLAQEELEGSLAAAVTAVAAGQVWFPRRADPELAQLTRRELEILSLLDRGTRVPKISQELGISETTVKAHTRSIFRKLGAHSRAEATYEARRRGVIR